VQQTNSFRETIAETTFGTLSTEKSSVQLKEEDYDKIVTSGMGFILLAWMMIEDNRSGEKLAVSIRNKILAEIPGKTKRARMIFVQNILKAYCNYYHLTVSELSVVVVEPVRVLINKLESIDLVYCG